MKMRSLSQGGEDRILSKIFRHIGVTNRCAVEFGALDGVHGSNTAALRLTQGWNVVLFDIAPLSEIVMAAKITAENVNRVFYDAVVPLAFDLLSIDIDSNDLWVWKALVYQPRVVVIEFNPRWGPTKSRVVPYDPDRSWDGSDYYGASVLALCRLGDEKGYALAASTLSNLVFVQQGLLPAMAPAAVYRRKKRKRVDPQRRKWVEYP